MTDWQEYSISIDSDAEESVSEILIELGASGVSIRNQKDLKNLPENDEDVLWGLDKNKFPASGIVVKAYFPQKDVDIQFDQLLHKKLDE
ncbi:MAG: 50S ribosomal protein L11 methyltransferase, partial [Atopostipes suicloacalis]|nr:50S ribosomal protein L11 methyltransferase [Atopostipes suicloacalis]